MKNKVCTRMIVKVNNMTWTRQKDMNPLLVTLLPTAVELLKEIGKTEFGQNAQKIIEVSIPHFKKASQLAVNFLATDIGGDSPSDNKIIHLSKSLDIVNNGLSLPLSYRENQFKAINQKISDDLDVIKGQNEILFLSNSINYFLESHKSRTGIDRGVSYALQYDIAAVCNHLKKNKDLRFPGYLLHQFTSLSETIKDLNTFYTSILQDGHVPEFDEQEIKEELQKEFGADKRRGELGIYVPHDIRMRLTRELEPVIEEKQKSSSLLSSFKDRVLTKDTDDVHSAHDALFVLKEELVSNEKLEYSIIKKIKILPSEKIIVQSGF